MFKPIIKLILSILFIKIVQSATINPLLENKNVGKKFANNIGLQVIDLIFFE